MSPKYFIFLFFILFFLFKIVVFSFIYCSKHEIIYTNRFLVTYFCIILLFSTHFTNFYVFFLIIIVFIKSLFYLWIHHINLAFYTWFLYYLIIFLWLHLKIIVFVLVMFIILVFLLYNLFTFFFFYLMSFTYFFFFLMIPIILIHKKIIIYLLVFLN